MSLAIALKLAFRELRGGVAGFRVFLLCLALGVAAITAIGSLREALYAGLNENGAALLGGDAEISLTYRFANPAERNLLHSQAVAVSEIADFRSMATHKDTRALTQIKAVDGFYPLTGKVKLSPDMLLSEALTQSDTGYGAVMDPVLIAKLGLNIGDTFTLGEGQYRLSAALLSEPDSIGAGITIGPRTLLLRSALEGSGLLAAGTLFNSSYRLKLAPGADLDTLRHDLETALPTSGLRWRDARNAAPGAAAFIERLSAFLVLVGFSGLAMGGVGVSMAVNAYLSRKIKVIATLRSLGAERRLIFQAYFIQISVLAILGISLGLLSGAALPRLLGPLLAANLPVPAQFAIYPKPLFEAALYGILTAAIFTLWPLAKIEGVRAAALFRQSEDATNTVPRWPYVITVMALLSALVMAAAAFSGSVKLTLYSFIALAIALATLALTALALRRLARTIQHRFTLRPITKLALASIGGVGSEAVPTVLSLGLGLSVLSAVGQIDGNLRGSITQQLPAVAPSYFFIDIQRDQIGPLTDRLEQTKGVNKIEAAPMLRGIISEINGKAAAEVAGDHWVIEGDRGITYYTDLPENWTLTEGTNWPYGTDGPPQLSFADEEAREMGLKLGDKLTLNILGRPIEAEITSFREVDFSTAGIGFVMAMNPGAVASAPHSYIATVYADETVEAEILNDVSKSYSNVTAIRVRDAIERVSEVLGTLASATRWGAAAAILAGCVVLIGAAGAGSPARAHEAALLKTLGASRATIVSSFLLRAALLGAFASLIALIAGLAAAWAVGHYIFETAFSIIWPQVFFIMACGIFANLAANTAFSLSALAARPAKTLRNQS